MEWDRLISDYLDDALGPEEVATLFQWIHSDPENAKRFASAAFLHRSLQHRVSAMRLFPRSIQGPLHLRRRRTRPACRPFLCGLPNSGLHRLGGASGEWPPPSC